MQFSLRSLLIATFLLAVLLGGWFGYRRATMARLAWLPLGSLEAEALFPAESVQATSDGLFEFTYHIRRGHLDGIKAPPGFSGLLALHKKSQTVYVGVLESLASPELSKRWPERPSYTGGGPTVTLITDEKSAAEEILQIFRDADVLMPGQMTIRGRIVDRKGRPLAGAIVDLMGPFVFINHFRTRSDGTFTLTLEDSGQAPPPGSGYFLRIRAAEETAERHVRWNTPKFALDPANPERVALVTVPR